jgi:hypothetical protein
MCMHFMLHLKNGQTIPLCTYVHAYGTSSYIYYKLQIYFIHFTLYSIDMCHLKDS